MLGSDKHGQEIDQEEVLIFYYYFHILKGPNTQHSGHMEICQTELMSEIYSKSQVRAIDKVLLMKFS